MQEVLTQPASAAGRGTAGANIANAVAEVLQGYRAYWPVYALVAAYVLIAHWHLGGVVQHMFILTLAEFVMAGYVLAMFLAFVVSRLAHYGRHGLPEGSLTLRILSDLRSQRQLPARLVTVVLLYPAYYMFAHAFLVIKSQIGVVSSFSWDAFFSRLDMLLHGGQHPWQWLYPWLSSGAVTTVVNFAYHLWFFITFASLLWVLVARRPHALRLQYLLAFMLAWGIGGSLLAHLFSSAGPVYYGRLGLSPDPYAPLMEHLRQLSETHAVWALAVQERLWQEYVAGQDMLGGISAFPSMHNAQATLLALLAWRLGRGWGIVATLYAVVIAIGSVWLGWHYAVDAYASVVLAVLCWWIAGRLAGWMMQRPAMQRLQRFQQNLLGNRREARQLA